MSRIGGGFCNISGGKGPVLWSTKSAWNTMQGDLGFPICRLPGQGGQECPPSVAGAPLSLFFDELLDAEVREFNQCYTDGTLLGQFRYYHPSIHGNRIFPGRRSLIRRDLRELRENVDGSIRRQILPNLRCGSSRAGCARIGFWFRNLSATACCRNLASCEFS